MSREVSAQWNTKRMYAPEGQIIHAQFEETENDEGRILFYDQSRGINGEIKIGWAELIKTPIDVQKFVMDQYDRSAYRQSAAADAYERKIAGQRAL